MEAAAVVVVAVAVVVVVVEEGVAEVGVGVEPQHLVGSPMVEAVHHLSHTKH